MLIYATSHLVFSAPSECRIRAKEIYVNASGDWDFTEPHFSQILERSQTS
jgi:hypothetical protein